MASPTPAPSFSPTSPPPHSIIHWFRRDLRLHDNPALCSALNHANRLKLPLIPVYVFHPSSHSARVCGNVRLSFILQSLRVLCDNLRTHNLHLHILHPKKTSSRIIPSESEVFLDFARQVNGKTVYKQAEYDEASKGVENDVRQGEHVDNLFALPGFTLVPPDKFLALRGDGNDFGKVPKTMLSFLSTFDGGDVVVDKPIDFPDGSSLKSLPLFERNCHEFDIPSFEDLRSGPFDDDEDGDKEEGVNVTNKKAIPLVMGGEDEALKSMNEFIERDNGRALKKFNKPETSPAAFSPRSTTGLSAHLALGTLSPRRLYKELPKPKATSQSQTQTTLRGQLLWREHFWLLTYCTENFEVQAGNAICRDIQWDDNTEFIRAWKQGRTGYPWIDALQRQLHSEGFVHHLGRHALACFLTRGDLWQSWQVGRDHFRKYLIDHDHALNAANWMWLSCSAFFHMYRRVYSPVAFAKKWPEHVGFVRRYVSELKKMPECYLLEPWKAPKSVQERAGCIVGKQYPKRIVVHEDISKTNMDRMKKEFERCAAKSVEGGGERGKRSLRTAANGPKKARRKK